MSGPRLRAVGKHVEAIFRLAARGFGFVEARGHAGLEPLDRLLGGEGVPGRLFCFAHCSELHARGGGALEMRDGAPCVMREPAHERDRVDARDRLGRGELAGRDHLERGAAMRASKIGQRLGGALEILGHVSRVRRALRRAHALAIVRGQFVIGRVRRSGGDRKIGGGAGRVAHRSCAQSRGA